MLLVALNLSGVFEIGTSLQGVGGQLADNRGGMIGSFLTGVLAVAVAAPCTAPFMGPAMGFALTQTPLVSLSVFAFLGLGLAAPFVALSFAPALLRLMPKPGAWMETLRNVLAFPMYGTAAWLVWVLAQQTASIGLALALAAAVLAAFAAWLFGRAQRRERAPVLRTLAAVALLGVAGLIYGLAVAPAPATVAQPTAAVDDAVDLPSEPWSPARVAALRAEGRPVFVNFTAAWCVTCQVNDAAAIARPATAEAFRKAGAVYLVADWTNRDGDIARALADHGRAGVPLYLVYGADGSDPVVLPQLLSEGMVVAAIDKAAKR
jgi:thiol:disulfide interchange protein